MRLLEYKLFCDDQDGGQIRNVYAEIEATVNELLTHVRQRLEFYKFLNQVFKTRLNKNFQKPKYVE